jgi:double-stranded uracil-DNA glycosylase
MSHRVIEEWMGEEVETLEDLLRPGLNAVCVGINPALTSVVAGHYYQGRLGQGFYTRLRRAGFLPHGSGWEDDLAFANGIGFTDIIKRPTASAKELRTEEYDHGKLMLLEKLEAARPELVIFTFKKTATILFGSFPDSGFIGKKLGGAEVFVMPGPYAPGATVEAQLSELRRSRTGTGSP